MNFVGKKVTHTKYGVGTIVEIFENKIRVDFKPDIKTFIYPDSFEKFLSLTDSKAKKYIDSKLNEINELKIIEQEQVEKEELLRVFKRKLKIKINSQAVFEMNNNTWNSFQNTWSVSTGTHLTGKNKGKSLVPKNINMNSACLLTMKPEGGTERDRIIVGIFMTPKDFIGGSLNTGIIPAHENYRIIWESEHDKLLFWDYFSDEAKLDKWGNSKMKYVSINLIKRILRDMIKFASEKNDKERIQDFYKYFCYMNNL